MSQRILVVDDNPAIHEDFRKILGSRDEAGSLAAAEAALFGEPAPASPASASFDVDSASQGADALELVERSTAEGRRYSVAFVDVRMPPGWDGIETTGRLWQADPDLQVVICTAYSDYSWDEMIAKLGQSDRLVILKKPFDNVEALQLATSLAHKWRLLQESKRKMADLERAVEARTAEVLKMEGQLRHAQKLESIGHLAAGIAHEINTPTQFIGDNLRFLKDAFRDCRGVLDRALELRAEVAAAGSASPALEALEAAVRSADLDYILGEAPKALDQSIEGVDRVTRIVGAMKEFSHPGVAGKEPTDLNRAIDTTLTVARSEWKDVAELVTRYDPELLPVPCVRGELNQAVLNLVVNAAHAIAATDAVRSGGRGTITVETRRTAEWAEIRIGDTGTGIPEAIRDKVFDPFFTTKEVGRGTGQGLFIAYGVVVEKHGGEISFESEIGRGTTFLLRLPFEERTGKAAVEEEAASSHA